MTSIADEFLTGSLSDTAPGLSDAGPTSSSPRVWLLDPFCFTPWYSAALASSLKDAGAEIRLISGTFSRERTYLQRYGLKAEPGPFQAPEICKNSPPPIGRAVRLAEVLLNTRMLARSLHAGGRNLPDILHFQQMRMLNHGLRSDYRLIEAAQQAGIRVVHTVHNLLPHDTGDRLRTIYVELYGRVDHLVCHSAGVAQCLRDDFRIPEHRISVIPHGPLFASEHLPSAAEKEQARTRLKLPRKQPIVLLQGVLATYKGLDVLLEAWKRCVQTFTHMAGVSPLLLIAGGGPSKLEAEVRQAVLAAGGSIRADLGYIPTHRLPDYYAAADLLVYPYRTITTSGALLTGLTYAKPIVASRLAPFEEYLTDGENARLVTPGDPAALADALTSLLQDLSPEVRPDLVPHRSPERRTEPTSNYAHLAHGATHNRCRYISWAEIGRRTHALYRELALRKPARYPA